MAANKIRHLAGMLRPVNGTPNDHRIKPFDVFDWLLAIGVGAENLTFRSLRKAVAAAVSDMAGVEVARDLLGHSDAAITEGHYAKRPALIVEVAADALDEVFAGIDA